MMLTNDLVGGIQGAGVDVDAEGETYDDIARALRALREEAGHIPYAEIVRRIARQRIREGVSPGTARPARTTVYDAFKLGRARLNPQLIGEIASALGEDEDSVVRWQERCRKAYSEQRQAEPTSAAAVDKPAPELAEQNHAHIEQPGEEEIPARTKPPSSRILLIIALCCALNFAGFFISEFLQIPLFLDMIGTAVVAIVLGPWFAVATGIAYHLIGLPIAGLHGLAMLPVSIIGALLWGYGVQRFRMASTLSRYLLLNIIVATSCTAIAVPSIMTFYNGEVRHSSAFLTDEFMAIGATPAVALTLANLSISLFDKLVTGFVALVMIDFMRDRPLLIECAKERLSQLPSFSGNQMYPTT